jgi:hypothetical protein
VGPDLQPYWYEHLGFPDMLEATVHAWHGNTIRDVLAWQSLGAWVESVKPYADRAATEAILRYAREQGLRFATYHDYCEEQLAERTMFIATG